MACFAATVADLPLREIAGILVALAATTVAVRHQRAASPVPHPVRSSAAILAAAGVLVIVVPNVPWSAMAWAAAAVVLIALLSTAREPAGSATDRRLVPAGAIATAATAFTAWFCLHELHRPDMPFVWEPEVFLGFEEALRSGTTLGQFVIQRLGWGWGLVSTSWDTLIWGSLTYAVFLAGEVSPEGQRLVAATLAVAIVPATFVAGRQFGGRTVGALAAGVTSIHPMVLFYGRYGIALSSTLLCLVLALAACMWVVTEQSRPILAGTAAAVALAVTTFGYAPARASVVAMAAVLAVRLAIGGRPRRRALIPLLVAATLLMALQVSRGEVFRFAHGRGEQLFSMLNYDYLVTMHMGDPAGDRHTSTGVALRLAARTIPEAMEVVARPLHPDLSAERAMHDDPPWLPLVPAALIPFTLLGIGRATRSLRSPSTQFLVALCAVALPMVFTTRIDAHRLMALAIPGIIWSAQGLSVFTVWLTESGIPRRWWAILLITLGVLGGIHAVSLTRPGVVHPGALPALRGLIEDSDTPVMMIVDANHRVLGGVRMAITRRWIGSGRSDDSGLMKPERVAMLRSGSPSINNCLPALLRMANSRGLVFHPTTSFSDVGERLSEMGLEVAPFDTGAGPGFTARRRN